MHKLFASAVSSFFVLTALLISIQSCKKDTVRESATDEPVLAGKKKPHDPPPPPPAFTFNCSTHVMTGNFVIGQPANVTVTFTYYNSPGGVHTGYTSAPVSGITFSTPPGTLNVGTGTITYTASGTPTYIGQNLAIVSLNGYPNVGCGFVINVLNAPSNCTSSSDPGPAIGSTGCVVFNYRGQQVAYNTVRAADGKIWLQQNLGSPQVASSGYDQASFGHYFQWGRWDDGHQLVNSPIANASTSLSNPADIPNGYPNFIQNWWNNGTSADTWSGTIPGVTNGKDPCAALGAGWRMPSRNDWLGVTTAEDITSDISAFMSRLKLPAAGTRGLLSGTGNYWTSTSAANGLAYALFFDNNYQAPIQQMYRGDAMTCRCVKD